MLFGARLALVAPDTTETELDRLHRGGIRGIRLNFETLGISDPSIALERFQLTSKQAAARAWHIQVNTRLSDCGGPGTPGHRRARNGGLRPLRAGPA
jgi:hypothetical protein